MKHGPLALVDEHMPILVVATRDGMWSKMQSVIAQLHARGAQLIVMCCRGDADAAALHHFNCRFIEVRSGVDSKCLSSKGRNVKDDTDICVVYKRCNRLSWLSKAACAPPCFCRSFRELLALHEMPMRP